MSDQMEELAASETEEELRDEQPPIDVVVEPASRQTPPSWSSNGGGDTQSKKASAEALRDKLRTKKKRQLKRIVAKRKDSPSVATGGAYYGGDIDREKRDAFHQQQQQRQAKQQSSRSGGGARRSKMASMSNSRFQELEDRLSEKTRINVAFAEQQLAERKEADQLRRARYVIPRHLAAPVERIVATYDDVRADLYAVLDVARSADDFALKRQYRALALQVHPGKLYIEAGVLVCGG